MKDLKLVAGEVLKGRNLHVNLRDYSKAMMSFYHDLAAIKLTMNYYTYHDMSRDVDFDREEFVSLKGLTDEFNEVMGAFLENGGRAFNGDSASEGENFRNESLDRLDNIRTRLTNDMEIITAHVDRLRVYEHVLNRVEYRFKEADFDEEYYASGLTNDLMHYILSDRDSVSVNGRISEVVEQLPMRLSKNKFYEYLRESFSLYKGAQVGTVEDFDYNLRSTGMLVCPEGFDTRFSEVRELCDGLRCADYRNLTREQYDNLSDRLTLASERMSSVADHYLLLAQLVNDLYTILLALPFAFKSADELARSARCIGYVHGAFASDNPAVVDEKLDELTDVFVSFEGKQERIGQMISSCDHAIDYALENYQDELKKCELYGCYKDLSVIMKLQSGSDFVQLKSDDFKLRIATDEKIESTCESLIAAFADSFENMDRMVYRAVMSEVLSQVPVFFGSIDEIQGYINTSLMLCSDAAEKAACVEILKFIMQQ